jgi:hypothetical protein
MESTCDGDSFLRGETVCGAVLRAIKIPVEISWVLIEMVWGLVNSDYELDCWVLHLRLQTLLLSEVLKNEKLVTSASIEIVFSPKTNSNEVQLRSSLSFLRRTVTNRETFHFKFIFKHSPKSNHQNFFQVSSTFALQIAVAATSLER